MGIINNQSVFIGPPKKLTNFRDNNDFSREIFKESIIFPDLPDDVGIAFVRSSDSPTDYVYFHLKGSNTKNVTLEASYGPIVKANILVEKMKVTGIITADIVKAKQFIGKINTQGWKHFDIKHPTKEGYRLRHSCLEGPENAVYYRGKLINNNIIQLPDYWRGFVDPESITVNLTPHGVYQELFVKSIEWGTRINIVNNLGGPINCSYVICGERIDNEKLIVEYEGKEPEDYPGTYSDE